MSLSAVASKAFALVPHFLVLCLLWLYIPSAYLEHTHLGALVEGRVEDEHVARAAHAPRIELQLRDGVRVDDLVRVRVRVWVWVLTT